MSAPSDALVCDVVCTACGCLCDDIAVTVSGGRIQAARNACSLGATWFLAPRNEERAVASIEGQPADFDTAVQRAAGILSAARWPLVTGLRATTCEAQRVAVGIADRLGACLDPTAADVAGGLAYQTVGAVRCSLGEVKQRADFVLFWGRDPQATHPRHRERYSVNPEGLFVPRGRADRTVVIVAAPGTTGVDADLIVGLKPGRDFELLWALRALVKGLALDPAVADDTGVPLKAIEDLAGRMKACRYGVVFYGAALSAPPGGRRCVEALVCLAAELNASTRFHAVPLGGPGNAVGAENVLTWQTGYPFAVDLGRGYPRFGPGEFTAAAVLARGEVDAAQIVGTDQLSDLPPAAREHLARIPTVVLDSAEATPGCPATVSFTTATYGIQTAGTVFRVDGVALPLRPALASRYPDAETVLRAIEERISGIGKM
jgi:formylmethanofuran dehydrogenase subunit B